MEYLESVLRLVAGLVGFPAALAALINVLKHFKILKDGQAPAASMVGHLLAYVGVAVLVLTGRVDLLPGLDLQLGAAANVLLAVLAFLASLNVARGAHDNYLTGLPVVGYSFRGRSMRALLDSLEYEYEPERDSKEAPEGDDSAV